MTDRQSVRNQDIKFTIKNKEFQSRNNHSCSAYVSRSTYCNKRKKKRLIIIECGWNNFEERYTQSCETDGVSKTHRSCQADDVYHYILIFLELIGTGKFKQLFN